MARVVAVIPALDEEAAIGLVVDELLPRVHEVVVVDNGSTDRTAGVAAAAGARVVREAERGYGAACLAGIAAARDADVLVFVDGDRSDHPEQVDALLRPLLAGEADLAIGSRTLGRSAPGAHPWHAVLGTRLCVGLMNALVGTRATDLGPFRAITADALRRLDMRDRSYGWTVEMQVKARQRGLRVVEVPVDYRPRIGRSKISGTLSGSLRAGWRIVETIFRLAGAGRSALLALCGAALSVCVSLWAIRGDATRHTPGHLATYGIAFAAYVAALHLARDATQRAVRAAVLLSLAWRAALVCAPPLLSDDVYRYVWEGRVQLHGGNPYTWDDRPEAPRWAALRDDTWRNVSHKEYGAIYPPLWQLAARAVVAVRDSVTAMKAFLVLCELGALAALARALRDRGLPAGRVLVLAWSPLALVEIAGSGHNDALGVLLVSLGLLAVGQQRSRAAAFALALGAQAKLLPALVAVAWARRLRARDLALAGAASALLVLPYASAGAWLWHSLGKYSRYWRFNETLFAVLAVVLPSHDAALRAAVLLTATVAAACGWRRVEPAAAALAVVAAWLLLAANVLPWYALWLLPMLVLRDEPALLLFTGTVSLAYVVYPVWLSGDPWHVGWGVRALEYLPCAVVAVLSRRRAAG